MHGGSDEGAQVMEQQKVDVLSLAQQLRTGTVSTMSTLLSLLFCILRMHVHYLYISKKELLASLSAIQKQKQTNQATDVKQDLQEGENALK